MLHRDTQTPRKQGPREGRGWWGCSATAVIAGILFSRVIDGAQMQALNVETLSLTFVCIGQGFFGPATLKYLLTKFEVFG